MKAICKKSPPAFAEELFVVRLKGLEPPRREASDPKSDVATNYTTAALISSAKVIIFLFPPNYLPNFIRFFLKNHYLYSLYTLLLPQL